MLKFYSVYCFILLIYISSVCTVDDPDPYQEDLVSKLRELRNNIGSEVTIDRELDEKNDDSIEERDFFEDAETYDNTENDENMNERDFDSTKDTDVKGDEENDEEIDKRNQDDKNFDENLNNEGLNEDGEFIDERNTENTGNENGENDENINERDFDNDELENDVGNIDDENKDNLDERDMQNNDMHLNDSLERRSNEDELIDDFFEVNDGDIREKRAASIRPITSSVTPTKAKFISTIDSALRGKGWNAKGQTLLIDDSLKRTIANKLKTQGVTSASGDKDLFLKKVRKILLDMNHVDDLEPEYSSILGSTDIPVAKTRTLAFKEIQRKSIGSLSGAKVDLTTVTKGTQFSLNNRKLNMKSLAFSRSTVTSLKPILAERSVTDFFIVATGIAKLTQLVAAKNNIRVSRVVPLENVAKYEGDISLEPDDIATILNETGEEPGLLDFTPSAVGPVSIATSKVLPTIAANLATNVKIQARSTGQEKEFRERVKRELRDLLQHFSRVNGNREEHMRVKRKATSRGSAKWKMPIKYRIKSGPASIIDQAINHWEKHTCLRFKKVGWTIGNHLVFKSGSSGCWSKLGRKPWYIFGQPVNIGPGCGSMGIVAHEIGHAIGFWHEQARPDRDRYIKVLSGNIQSGRHSQFTRKSWKNILSFGIPYDYSSVMHYGSKAFAKPGTNTILTKENGYDRTIGSRHGLSFYDAKLANYLYNCHSKCGKSTLTWSACKNGGYRDPNNCSQCKCLDGWSGKYCTYPQASNSACGSQLRYTTSSTWKTLQSPGYSVPPGYPPKSKCTWKVYTGYGRRIVMRFPSSNQFYLGCSRSCIDYVEIMYKHLSRAGERYCCSRPTKYFRSHGPTMLVNLRANSPYSRKGFKAEYKAEACGGCFSSTPTQPVCLRAQQYSCPGKYYVGCGFWNLKRCARYRSNTCYRTSSYCCTHKGYVKFGYFCKKKYGNWGSWGNWSSCSATCGGCGRRYRQRTRACLIQTCTPSSLKQTRSEKCSFNLCPIQYRSVSHKTTTRCGWLGWRRCTKIYYKRELKPRCCTGYRVSGSKCVPISG